MEALLLVVERNEPTMFARIGRLFGHGHAPFQAVVDVPPLRWLARKHRADTIKLAAETTSQGRAGILGLPASLGRLLDKKRNAAPVIVIEELPSRNRSDRVIDVEE
jgi:hypothetical protein